MRPHRPPTPSQDYLDHRYHARRALYLAAVARVLSKAAGAKEKKAGKKPGAGAAASASREWKCAWGALAEDPRKPVLLVTAAVRAFSGLVSPSRPEFPV